jgi:hypothetical protein
VTIEDRQSVPCHSQDSYRHMASRRDRRYGSLNQDQYPWSTNDDLRLSPAETHMWTAVYAVLLLSLGV